MSSSEDSYDSTYEGSESSSAQSEPSEQKTTKSQGRQLSATELDDLWQQLNRVDQNRRERDTFLQTKRQESAELNIKQMTTLPDGLFASYVQQSQESNQTKEHLEKLQKYAPKIITIQETQRFWQMYKNSLSVDQVQILQSYVASQSSYLERKRFLGEKRAK